MQRIAVRDLPGCAWTVALAYTYRRWPIWLRRCTAVVSFTLYLAVLVLLPRTFHHERRVVMSLHHPRERPRVHRVVVAIVVLIVVEAAGQLLGVADWLFLAVVIGPITVSAVVLVVEQGWVRVRLGRANRGEKEAVQGVDWVLSTLANRPGAGVRDATGLALATANQLGQRGATIGLFARNAALVRHYERHGFQSVPGGLRQMRRTLADVG